MAGYLLSPCITVMAIPGKGRGIVATARIEAGTVVERSPLLVLPPGVIPDRGHPLSDFVYVLHEPHEDGRALGLGYASLYNHSRNPNCDWDFDSAPPAIVMTAIRGIEAGEELTIDYGIPLWFREA